MAASFFFYDLETSGFDPKYARIMQFAGQRTDLELRPLGEPVNVLIKLTPDVLPDPDSVLVTGITPQVTLTDGITEAEFLKFFYTTVCQPHTTFLGYNSVRFDDEFMRYLHYRNFYDAYEWQWCDGCSRWDVLDLVRVTRALRPDGITWPFASDGRPTNALSFLTSVNGLDHENAHDALADVRATIAVARLIRSKQPKLFDYLLELRDKKKVAAVALASQPFVYTSGAYPSEFEKTSVVMSIGELPNKQGVLVYDLRHNPVPLAKLSTKELKLRMGWQPRDGRTERFPVKALRFGRCPAVAPLNVLDPASQTRLKLDMSDIRANCQALEALPELTRNVREVYASLQAKDTQSALVGDEHKVDGQLYDGFLSDHDRRELKKVRGADVSELASLHDGFDDPRLKALLPLYKARNFPDALDSDERATWEAFCRHRLLGGGTKSRAAKYFERLQAIADRSGLSQKDKYLLEELQLYAESIMPLEP